MAYRETKDVLAGTLKTKTYLIRGRVMRVNSTPSRREIMKTIYLSITSLSLIFISPDTLAEGFTIRIGDSMCQRGQVRTGPNNGSLGVCHKLGTPLEVKKPQEPYYPPLPEQPTKSALDNPAIVNDGGIIANGRLYHLD